MPTAMMAPTGSGVAAVDRQRVWRGLPQSTAVRRAPPKHSSMPSVIPLDWDPAGDESAQDAAIRAAQRVKVRPPDAAPPSFSTFQAATARPPEFAKQESTRQADIGVKDESARQSERGVTAARAAARAAAEARKTQAAAATAARAKADQAAAKAAVERVQPLQLARASLATAERCRRLRDQPSRLKDSQREPPSEAGRALLAAIGVDENANTHRSQPKPGGMPRARPSSGRLKESSGGGGRGGGVANVPLMPSGRPPSRTRPQSSHSVGSSYRGAPTPWLGIGFDGANADPYGREVAWAHGEPPAGEEELEVVCEPDDADARLRGLQAELERVRLLEAMLQSEKERGMRAVACE